MRRAGIAVVLTALISAGCGFVSGLFADETSAVEHTYRRFHQAVTDGDIKAARAFVSAERAAEFDAPDAAEKFQLAAALVPARVTISRIDIAGADATIHATSQAEGATVTGTVKARKEGGSWKIAHESWNVSMRLDATRLDAGTHGEGPRRPGVMRPNGEEYAKLRGQWKGTEVGTTNEWTFSFGDAYAVVVTDGVRTYEGLAAFHPELGAERDGSIRVKPGSGVIDIDVVNGSEEYAGKTSLGMYYFTSPTEIDFCGSRPGAFVRVQSYTSSTRDVRCFHLAKVADQPLPSSVAASVEADVESARSRPVSVPADAEEKGDPGVIGEALLQFDGSRRRYSLSTGFFYDTRFRDPTRATIQFHSGQSNNLTAGLHITLDATRSGAHATSDGTTSVRWITDGGQVFQPVSPCVVRVTSPYTGGAEGAFKGEIDRCVVHSAGIDHTLSAVRFVMIGAPAR